MGRGRRGDGDDPGARKAKPPIPLEPIDLLAGLAPGLELQADDAPAGLDEEVPEGGPASLTVAEAGKMIRSGDETIRRLIRMPGLRPADAVAEGGPVEIDRAGVLPPRRDKPGE